MGTLISYDSLLGTAQYLHEEGSKTVLETVAPINIEIAKDVAEERKEFDEHSRWGEMAKVASVPLSIWYSLPRELRHDKNAMRKWLDGPGSIWKTRPGRLSK